MSITKRKRCPECGFLDVIKWGFQNKRQRFKCNNCSIYFTRSRKDISRQNRFVWFERWILGKQTLRQLSAQSGYSEKSLRRWFDEYLSSYPQWEIRRSEKLNLMIDGTFFSNKVCLVLYRDNNVKATILYRLRDGEWEDELREDLENILSLGVRIESVTTDGGRNIIKSVRKSCPEAIVQRCTVHVERECLNWLTRNPKSEAGRELRRIVRRLNRITDREGWGYWVVALVRWEERHRKYLNQKTVPDDDPRWAWFTHKMVSKAFVHIRRALPDMFHYWDYPSIPKSNNSLESFLGHLKQNISLHRGLSKVHYQNYVKWYLYFVTGTTNAQKNNPSSVGGLRLFFASKELTKISCFCPHYLFLHPLAIKSTFQQYFRWTKPSLEKLQQHTVFILVFQYYGRSNQLFERRYRRSDFSVRKIVIL